MITKVSVWVRCYYRIFSANCFKKLDNARFQTEHFSMESNINGDRDNEVYVSRHQYTGESGNPIGIVLRYSTRVHKDETPQDAYKRCEIEGIQAVHKWMEENKLDIENSF